jgi:hypothetical protein
MASGVDLIWWNDGVLRKARAATLRNPDELRVKAQVSQEKRILPTCLEVVWKIRDRFWSTSDWSTEGLDRRGIWIAIGLTFDSGMRIGNFTLRDGRLAEDHCVRAGQFVFLVSYQGEELRVSGGNLAQWLREHGQSTTCVKLCDVNVSSTKVSRKSAASRAPSFKKIARRTEAESTFLDDLVAWVRGSKVLEDDEITARYSSFSIAGEVTRRVVRRKEVANAIKEAHALEGLPPGLFSCKSLRAGFSSHADSAGVATEDRNSRGGWASGSKVPEKSYTVRLENAGALAFVLPTRGTTTHGIESIRRMMAPNTRASVSEKVRVSKRSKHVD